MNADHFRTVVPRAHVPALSDYDDCRDLFYRPSALWYTQDQSWSPSSDSSDFEDLFGRSDTASAITSPTFDADPKVYSDFLDTYSEEPSNGALQVTY